MIGDRGLKPTQCFPHPQAGSSGTKRRADDDTINDTTGSRTTTKRQRVEATEAEQKLKIGIKI